jgi:hypothetical protein
MDPETNDGATPAADTTTQTEPQAPPVEPPKESSEIRFRDTKALSERMDRNFESRLKKLGIEDPGTLKDSMARLAEYEKQREEQRQADLSEQERLQETLATEKTAREEAERQLQDMRHDLKVRDTCAELKITNLDYARFKLAEAARAHTGDEPFDAKAALEKALDTDAVALGAKSPDPASVPATTSPEKGEPPPPSPNNGGAVDASKMTPDEFRQFCAERGY